MNNIPILDLTPEIEARFTEYTEAFQTVLRSGHFIMGPQCAAFEKEIASYLGVKHAIGCNSGTDALVIALRALGVGPEDEVITPSFTFFATAESVSAVGAKPIFAEVDPVSFNIDPADLERRITKKTKAIVPVHLYGHSARMDEIQTIAKRHGLKIVEDVAQAMGGAYRGKKLGTIGDVGAFSFFPSKNLGAFGDGGLITTNDDNVADMAKMLRTHGSKKKYYNELIGYNSRLDEMQAAMLRIKLKHLEKANEGRRHAASRYAEVFKGVPGVTTPTAADYAHHVFHQYTLRITNGQRDRVQEVLTKEGITTMLYYPVPLHKLPVYAGQYDALPITEELCTETISLPIWPEITPEIQLRVCEAVRSALK